MIRSSFKLHLQQDRPSSQALEFVVREAIDCLQMRIHWETIT